MDKNTTALSKIDILDKAIEIIDSGRKKIIEAIYNESTKDCRKFYLKKSQSLTGEFNFKLSFIIPTRDHQICLELGSRSL